MSVGLCVSSLFFFGAVCLSDLGYCLVQIVESDLTVTASGGDVVVLLYGVLLYGFESCSFVPLSAASKGFVVAVGGVFCLCAGVGGGGGCVG